MDYFGRYPIHWVMPMGAHMSFFQVLIVIYMILACLVSAPLLSKVTSRAGELPLRNALTLLRLGNPMRAINIIFNTFYASLNVLSMPEEEEEKKE